MRFDLKNQRKLIFVSIAIFILAVLLFMTYSALSFMENTIESTLSADGGIKTQPIRFDFEKLKEIGIVK